MPKNIDHSFISKLEGGSKSNGYVPASKVSQSGVTIATGFDLGQRNESDLKSLALHPSLMDKLKPYLGLKSQDAKKALNAHPLVIAPDQAVEIDKAVKKKHIEQLELKYNSNVNNAVKFSDLPREAQTVLASISFQYGVGLDVRAPKFWEAVTKQDWNSAIEILKDFSDAYPTRRNKEAELLENINE